MAWSKGDTRTHPAHFWAGHHKMAAASSVFITDAIAEFKSKLDTLMEESLTKYREQSVAGLEEDYTPGYGEITTFVNSSYTANNHDRTVYSLPTAAPTYNFNISKGVWFIHSCSYTIYRLQCHYNSISNISSYMADGLAGFAIDNYGNIYNYTHNSKLDSWKSPIIGSDSYVTPLTNSIINILKIIPTNLGIYYADGYRYNLYDTFLPIFVGPLAKHAAKIIFDTSQSTLYLQQELEAERAKTAALEAELRALKATAPPTEDLLGITTPSPLAAAVIESEEIPPSSTSPLQLCVTDTT